SYRVSLYGARSCHMVGINTPRSPWSAAHSTSAMPRSTSCDTGTRATPARRTALPATRSARKRLWARAPAYASSGSAIAPAESPAPNGGDSIPVIASASGKITSPATPSASSSLSRCSPQPLLVRRLPLVDVVVVELQRLVAVRRPFGQERVEGVEVPGLEVWPVFLTGQSGMAVGRDDEVALVHRRPPGSVPTLAQPTG